MATYQYQGQDIVAPFRVTSNEPAFAADTVSLRQRRITQGNQRWELEFGVVMQDPTDFFVNSISTFNDVVTMEMPQLNVRGETISSGTSTAAIDVATTALAGSSTVVLANGTSLGTINKGRFVKFSNHNKIYMVTSTTTLAADGTGTLNIHPPLRENVVSTTDLLYRDSDSITFRAYRDITNTNGVVYTDGVLSEAGNINLIEAL